MENIQTKRVQSNHRLAFLPSLLGRDCVAFENLVYNYMGQFCETYNGGYWEFYRLSNGGFFIALDEQGLFPICNPENYTDTQMSAQAAGIGVCLYALNALAWQHESDQAADLYHLLRDYAAQHPEGAEIMGFID